MYCGLIIDSVEVGWVGWVGFVGWFVEFDWVDENYLLMVLSYYSSEASF